MSPDDWLRAEELFHIVIAMSAEERPAYLTRACSQDASLRAEVESLIAAFENQPELMNHPVLSLGLQALSDKLDEAPLVGKQIGPYAVLELLGRGGMGDVYLAMDGRLDRKVALKFLSSKLIDDAWAKRQFIKEAHTVAKLNHPNICAVYEFEEYDGYRFIAMQHVEGETLASLISKRLIEPEQILPIAIQIVSALVEAHSHGISHRDIKPQNIII
ncbi:MAG TPA: serine/threonine-protein kinase, partial [Blastocatellia bacterium]|nr:serine/threonine-protein kinase [Blastocatellia bacterium]